MNSLETYLNTAASAIRVMEGNEEGGSINAMDFVNHISPGQVSDISFEFSNGGILKAKIEQTSAGFLNMTDTNSANYKQVSTTLQTLDQNNFKSENILQGKTIFGVSGEYNPPGSLLDVCNFTLVYDVFDGTPITNIQICYTNEKGEIEQKTFGDGTNVLQDGDSITFQPAQNTPIHFTSSDNDVSFYYSASDDNFTWEGIGYGAWGYCTGDTVRMSISYND